MTKLQNIAKIAKKLGLKKKNIDCYGNYMAKINEIKMKSKKGKLILISSINPTKFGEGKTTVAISLADSLKSLKKKAILALREPSLGPVFGVKGGATGGGNATIEPKDKINLHFTGDFHAITSTNNLLCALIDNHLYHGNSLNIDENNILFHRCIDMNDRALREITISQEKLNNNVERKENFVITAASEIMAILCLSKDIEELKSRLGDILIAYSKDNKPLFAKDLKAENSMAILLKDAIKPNLVQTLNGTPAIVHGGPFANIAHGCNSFLATDYALNLGDYCITEAGFGGDLGGEKFLDFKCRLNNFNPNIIILVVTIKALKAHGTDGALEKGFENLQKHLLNFKNIFNKNVIIAINKFDNDNEKDIKAIIEYCKQLNFKAVVSSPYFNSKLGCVELAKEVIKLCEYDNSPLKFSYDFNDSIKNKISDIAIKVYGAKKVVFSKNALKKIKLYEKLAKGFAVIIAKTQYSLSDNEKLLGAPRDFIFHVQDVEIKNGAKFIVAKAGKITLMPGLPAHPNSEKMELD